MEIVLCGCFFPDADCRARYNTFFVLYPLGISSECWLMYKAIDPAQSWNLAYGYVIKAILFIYVPGRLSRAVIDYLC